MQERTFPIKASDLARGLRPDSRNPRNVQNLTECVNLRAEPFGLCARADVELIPDFPVAFPFPQWFVGRNAALIAKADEIVDGVSLETLAVYDAANIEVETDFESDGPWQFVDLGESWILVGDGCVVFKSADATLGGKVLVNDSFPVNAAAEFNGRVLMGGFNESAPHSFFGVLKSNYVCWTGIRAGDIFWPFTTAGSTREDHEYRARGDYGYQEMPWQGEVLAIKPLGDKVIVYGDAGIAVLAPAALDGIHTFGVRLLSRIGIKGRCAVGGDRERHVWIDAKGCLNSMGADYRPVRLGFEEYFAEFPSNAVVSYEEDEREFYISSEDTCFVLSQSGLSRDSRIVTSMARLGSVLYGFTDGGDSAFQFTTGTFDLGIRTIKMIDKVQIAGTDVTDLEARIEYRYDGQPVFFSSEWVPANQEQIAWPRIAALDFRISVRGTAGPTAKIDYLMVHYKAIDKRPIGGLVANNAGEAAS